MGWANCGTDNHGRPIGYAISAACDHPRCNEKIDRGLAHACGGMHGNAEDSCDRYFCASHLVFYLDGDGQQRCEPCARYWDRESGAAARRYARRRSRRNQITRRHRRHGRPR